MRVLFLNPTASMGGAERVLLDLLTTLRTAEPAWTFGLIAGNDGPLVEEARRLSVWTHVLPFPREFARIGDAGLHGPRRWAQFIRHAARGSVATLRYLASLRRAVATFRPDVVHSNGIKMHVLGALARPAHAALVWHFHDYLGARPVTCRIIRRLKRRCHTVVAVSDSVAHDIRHQLGPMTPVVTIRNAVDLTHFSPSGSRLDLDRLAALPASGSDVVRVGLVATFARWKGHLLFLDALRQLRTTHQFRAYVVGGALYETDSSQLSRQELEAAVARMGLTSHVGLTGFVGDTAPVLRSLDVVVHASTSPEPFGLVIAEAMATGRALIISQEGGVTELVEPDRTALTYPARNAVALAGQLRRLIEDATLRTRLGTAAHHAARHQFKQSRVVTQMLEAYAAATHRAAA